jgi:hypothetical protein
MSLGPQAARIVVGIELFHKPIEGGPRNMLQDCMKNDILVLHGVDSFSCPDDSQPAGTQ